MQKRVVITGMGVVAPNGVGLAAFENAIKNGTSGIKFDQQLADLDLVSPNLVRSLSQIISAHCS